MHSAAPLDLPNVRNPNRLAKFAELLRLWLLHTIRQDKTIYRPSENSIPSQCRAFIIVVALISRSAAVYTLTLADRVYLNSVYLCKCFNSGGSNTFGKCNILSCCSIHSFVNIIIMLHVVYRCNVLMEVPESDARLAAFMVGVLCAAMDKCWTLAVFNDVTLHNVPP